MARNPLAHLWQPWAALWRPSNSRRAAPARRTRLGVEALEDKCLLSVSPLTAPLDVSASHAPTHLAATTANTAFDGLWRVTYNVNLFGSHKTGSFPVTVSEGNILVAGHKVGSINSANQLSFTEKINNFNVTLTGSVKVTNDALTFAGTFKVLGLTGTFSAERTSRVVVPPQLANAIEFKLNWSGNVSLADGGVESIGGTAFFTLKNNVIAAELASGSGKVASNGAFSATISYHANGASVTLMLTGTRTLDSQGRAHFTGTWTGNQGGVAASGTWNANPTGLSFVPGASSALASTGNTKFDGLWHVTFNVPVLHQTGAFTLTVSKGAILVAGHKVGSISSSGRVSFVGTILGAPLTLTGTVRASGSVLTFSGTFKVLHGLVAGTLSATHTPLPTINTPDVKEVEYKLDWQGSNTGSTANGFVFFTLKNGVLAVEGGTGNGTVASDGSLSGTVTYTANNITVTLTLTGARTIDTAGKAHFVGTWTGTENGDPFTGTWGADPTGKTF